MAGSLPLPWQPSCVVRIKRLEGARARGDERSPCLKLEMMRQKVDNWTQMMTSFLALALVIRMEVDAALTNSVDALRSSTIGDIIMLIN